MLVYDLTGSALGTGVLAALQAVPYLLFGLIAGAIADRADRRRIMIGCNVLMLDAEYPGRSGDRNGRKHGGLVAEVTSIRTTYLLMALGVAVSALVGWFSPVRSSRVRCGDPSAHGCGQANSQM